MKELRIISNEILYFYNHQKYFETRQMKHAIKSKQSIDPNNFIIIVQLFPDNLAERLAIKNMESMTATEDQKNLVENYLNFYLEPGNYSIVEALSQTDTTFVLKIFI